MIAEANNLRISICKHFQFGYIGKVIPEEYIVEPETMQIELDLADKASTPLRLHGAVLNLLASCAELVDVKDERSLQKRLAPAFDYLQENYNKSVSVEVLARLCHLSESQLRRLFRRQTGKSPIAYKNELLLNSAKRLLKYGDLSIGEIADSLGFYDIYAFSHFFSASVGISPSEYRRSQRESGAREEKA